MHFNAPETPRWVPIATDWKHRLLILHPTSTGDVKYVVRNASEQATHEDILRALFLRAGTSTGLHERPKRPRQALLMREM